MNLYGWWILKRNWRFLLAVFVPFLLLPVPLVIGTDASKCAYVMLLMAIYWMFELLPLAVTSLIPVALFPLMGVMSTGDVTARYMTATGMLFVGSLILALAIEECGLHRRVALRAMLVSGTSPRMLLLGFMLPTAFLSMWISNTATTVLMIPTMEAVVRELRDYDEEEERGKRAEEEGGIVDYKGTTLARAEKTAKMRSAMLSMAICISANVGGNATIIGSSINVVLLNVLDSSFGDDHPLNFAAWMGFALPSVVLNLVAIWLWLQVYYLGMPTAGWLTKKRGDDDNKADKTKSKSQAVADLLRIKCEELGPMTYHELTVFVIFVVVAIMWFFRSPGFMTGWGDLLQDASGDVRIADATPTILMVLFLFLLPAKPTFLNSFSKSRVYSSSDDSGDKEAPSPRVIEWKTVETKLPWGIILLMGGGFALADASEKSCLSAWIGQQLLVLEALPPWALSTVLSLIACLLTQFVQNTATASMLLPVYRQLAITAGINPIYLMLPPTLVVSYSFLLPISSAPNAIVFRSSGMTLLSMAKVGSGASLLCVIVTLVCINTYGYYMFDLGTYPDWAGAWDAANSTNTCLSVI